MEKNRLILVLLFILCWFYDASAQCPNLIINGDFEDNRCPSVSFKSTLLCNQLYPGTYNIGVNAFAYNYGWHGLDHTNPGMGKFFIGDGPSSVSTDAKIWYQTISVTANREYLFTAWVSNVDIADYSPDPILNLSIGGTIVATSGYIAENTLWHKMSGTWTAPADMTVEVAVVIKGGYYGGNDFGVDDISLIATHPVLLTPTVSDKIRCGAGNVVLSASGASSYKWYSSESGTFPVNTNSSLTINVTNDTTTYYVSAIDHDGCESTRMPVRAIINPMPDPDLGPDTSICQDSSYTFDGGASYNYFYWNNDLSDSTNRYFQANKIGKYWVTVVNQYGCKNTDTVYINGLYPLPVADAGNDVYICAGETKTLTASGGNRYRWLPTGDNTISMVVSPVTTSIYQVIAYDTIHGCKPSYDAVTVYVHPIPTEPAFKEKNVSHCFETEAISISASWGTSFSWLPGGDTSQYITVYEEGKYSVKVSDQFGCSVTDEITIENKCLPVIYLPLAFSPNKDGANDELQIFGKHFKNFELIIFNRWGEIIFVSNDKNYTWDGTYRGEEMPVGTYPWMISYESVYENDDPKTIKGSITLVR